MRATPASIARRAPRAVPTVVVAGEDSISARLDDAARAALWALVGTLDNTPDRATASALNESTEAGSLVP